MNKIKTSKSKGQRVENSFKNITPMKISPQLFQAHSYFNPEINPTLFNKIQNNVSCKKQISKKLRQTVDCFKSRAKLNKKNQNSNKKYQNCIQAEKKISLRSEYHKNENVPTEINEQESQQNFQPRIKVKSIIFEQKNQHHHYPYNQVKIDEGINEQSPYIRFSSNCFPRKQNKPLIKMVIRSTMNTPNSLVKNSHRQQEDIISDTLQKMESKYSQIDMTANFISIFAIEEKQHPGPRDHKRKKKILKELAECRYPSMQIMRAASTKINEGKQICMKIPSEMEIDKVYGKKILSYITFLLKVNYSNGIKMKGISLSDKYNQNNRIKVYVGPGNNKYLLISLLKRRFWLEVCNKITKDTKFIWTQNSSKDIHQEQLKQESEQTFSSTRYNKTAESVYIFRKEKEFEGQIIKNKYRSKKEQIKFHNKRIKYHKDQNNKLFLKHKQSQQVQQFIKKNKNILFDSKELLQNKYTITNHIPNNCYISSKKGLFYTMQYYYKNVKFINPFSIIPRTYHIEGINSVSYHNFMDQQKYSNNIWIVKPGQCTNRGNGIRILRREQITRRLLKKQYHRNGQIKTIIIQQYIRNPLLYYRRKFDIRHYMMLTVINGCIKAYWYNEGYLRTSSEIYTQDELNDLSIHLTNDAVQCKSEFYGRFEPANKVSYGQFQRYIDSHLKIKCNFREQILSKMKNIAKDIITANFLHIDQFRRRHNFQIFGIDFMIDTDLQPWLIEVNSNPCLQISCPLLSRIIPTMLQHSLRIGLDPLLPPNTHYPNHQRYYLSDNFLQNLKYEIIFDEKIQKKSKQLLSSEQLFNNIEINQPEDQYENQGKQIDINKLLN